ncbi:hypothetical protein NKG05_16150 [Oerskovia sp. M15]
MGRRVTAHRSTAQVQLVDVPDGVRTGAAVRYSAAAWAAVVVRRVGQGPSSRRCGPTPTARWSSPGKTWQIRTGAPCSRSTALAPWRSGRRRQVSSSRSARSTSPISQPRGPADSSASSLGWWPSSRGAGRQPDRQGEGSPCREAPQAI